MRKFWPHLTLFLLVAGIAGATYWLGSAEDDRWAYYVDGQGRRVDKFKWTWPEQIVICAATGSLVAAPMTALVFVIEVIRSRRAAAASRQDEKNG